MSPDLLIVRHRRPQSIVNQTKQQSYKIMQHNSLIRYMTRFGAHKRLQNTNYETYDNITNIKYRYQVLSIMYIKYTSVNLVHHLWKKNSYHVIKSNLLCNKHNSVLHVKNSS